MKRTGAAAETMERCWKLGLLGQESEKLHGNDAELSLDVLSRVLGERQRAELDSALAFAAEEQEVAAHKRRKPTGGKPLPSMPRFEIIVLPPEVEKRGLDAQQTYPFRSECSRGAPCLPDTRNA